MAGIPLLSGFNITSDSPADTRLVLTKAEMKAMKDTSMPQTYFCTDSESGEIYVYNKSNKVDETTGKFRKFESGGVKTVNGNSPDTNGNLITDNLRSTLLASTVNIKDYADSLSASITGMYIVRRIGADAQSPTPADGDYHYSIYRLGDGSTLWTRIIALDIRSNTMYQCAKTNGVWSDWSQEYANVVPCTIEQYDAMSSHDYNTLYLIKEY